MPKRTKSYREWLLKRLVDPNEAKRYLNIALSDSPSMFLRALRNVAEAKRMAKVAEDTGLSRENLYHTLSEEGNPTFETLNAVLGALALQMKIDTTQSSSAPSGSDQSGSTPMTVSTSYLGGGTITTTGGGKYQTLSVDQIRYDEPFDLNNIPAVVLITAQEQEKRILIGAR